MRGDKRSGGTAVLQEALRRHGAGGPVEGTGRPRAQCRRQPPGSNRMLMQRRRAMAHVGRKHQEAGGAGHKNNASSGSSTSKPLEVH